MRTLSGRPFVLATVALLVACAHREMAHHEEHTPIDYAAAEVRLLATGTADSLATAAVLKRYGAETDSGAFALAARAVELAPERRDIAWLAIRLCMAASDCNSLPYEQHLRTIEPANAAGWVGTLQRARTANNENAVDGALAALGSTERFDVYFNPLVVATSRALAAAQHTGEPKADRNVLANATVAMISIVAATVLPTMQPLAESCRGRELEIAGRLQHCQRAAQVYERGDTYIAEGLGLSIQQRLWPAVSPQAHSIAEQRRVLRYRLEESNRLPVALSKAADLPADYLNVLQTHAREQDAALVYLHRAGVPIDPPPQWVSSVPPRFP
ncbi:MAG: hypothetical protein ACREVV_19620 [Steroidobacteraceae bacterium]